MAKGSKCGSDAGFLMDLCPDCMPGKLEQQDLEMEQQDLENKKAAREKQVDSERRIPSVILTTAPSIEGYGIADTGDIVTVECVKGMSMFKDWFSEARNLSDMTPTVLDGRNASFRGQKAHRARWTAVAR